MVTVALQAFSIIFLPDFVANKQADSRYIDRLMSENTDFIAAAKANSEREAQELEHAIETDRTRRFFQREEFSIGSLFEGMFLIALLALVPFIAFAGLALWSFGPWSDNQTAPWVFFAMAVIIPIFVFTRAMKSKSEANVSFLADMVGAFWTGVFPFVLFGGIAVFALATWLGVSFQIALGILFLAGFFLFFLANQ